MGNLLRRWMNTPTRGELRELQAAALREQIAAGHRARRPDDAESAARDRARKAHELVAVEHTCSQCFAAGFAAGFNYKRKHP